MRQGTWCVRRGVPCVLMAIALVLAAVALARMAPVVLAQSTGAGWTHLSTEAGDLPLPGGAYQQTTTLILDIDQDGLNDFVIGMRTEPPPSVVWYRRHEGGWDRYVIDDEVLNIEAGSAYHDIDGDGDLDIVMGGDYRTNEVWWWENPYPDLDPATPWVRRTIKNTGDIGKHHDQAFGDVDGDGQVELVFWHQLDSKLILAEIPDDPQAVTAWPLRTIFAWGDSPEYEGLAIADMDLDGTLDIVGGGCWFRHEEDGEFSVHLIDADMRYTRTAVGQLIPGGRPEVVLVCGDCDGPLRMYEWDGAEWVAHTLLPYDIDHGHSLQVADMDGDGHLDIFIAEMRLGGDNETSRTMILYGDGAGGFDPVQVATGYDHHESKVGDLDGDGDMDILGKPYNHGAPRVDIWLQEGEGTDLPLGAWERHVVGSGDYRLLSVHAGDLNADGRMDLIAGAWWFENPGAPSGEWARRQLPQMGGVVAVLDVDGDGAPDLLGTRGQGSDANSEWLWLENPGDGASWTVHDNLPSLGGNFVQGAVVADLVAGGNVEIAISWHDEVAYGVHMFGIPNDPTEPWSIQEISSYSQGEALSAGDIDGDGDLDLLLGTAWLENPGAAGGEWAAHTFAPATDLPDRNALVDMDGDGDLDAVVGYELATEIVWFEAPDDPATGTWARHVIAEGVGYGFSMDVADLDGDGDHDVVLGEHKLERRVLVFENLGAGAAWRQHVVDEAPGAYDHHVGTQLFDVTGNGLLDIASVGWNHTDVLLYTRVRTHQVWLPRISFWGGADQTFGLLGRPHDRVVIHGTISDAEGMVSLSYSLNGGSPAPLVVGPLAPRLPEAGDFLVELDVDELAVGDNTLQVTATGPSGASASEALSLQLHPQAAVALPVSVDWSDSGLGTVAHPVDGRWHTESGWLSPVAPGDWQGVAFGDGAWQEYEVTAPIIIRDLQAQDAGVGIGLHWQGYVDDGGQPSTTRYVGALGWYQRAGSGSPRLAISDEAGAPIAVDRDGKTLDTGYANTFRVRVQADAEGDSVYHLKAWRMGTDEPEAWDVTGFGAHAGPGAIWLAAHRAAASIGAVDVRPGPFGPPVSDVSVQPGATALTVRWRTPSLATSRLLLGRDATYDLPAAGIDLPVRTHEVTVSGLLPETTYHLRAVAADGTGEGYSGNVTLRTRTAAPPAIASDDFSSGALNEALWSHVDPLADGGLAFEGSGTEDARLLLTAAAGAAHEMTPQGNAAPRVMQLAPDRDMVVEAKFDGLPAADGQAQGILFEQDSGAYLWFAFRREEGSLYAWAGRLVGGTLSTVGRIEIAPSAAPIYLRAGREGNWWRQWYSYDGERWHPTAAFAHTMQVNRVGLFAANGPADGTTDIPEMTAVVDYLMDTVHPIVAEDGPSVSLDVRVEGSGQVERWPERPAYHLGETVELRAQPATGWQFAGWGGAVSGATNPVTVTVSEDLAVVARFSPVDGPGGEHTMALPLVRR